VFKKALKVAITFAVLLAAHVGYVQIFAIVARRAAWSRPMVVQLQPADSRTKKEAIALAGRAFGEGHWSADRELPGRYYNKERGYWMYYKEYERRPEGKQYLFKPFALIWQSKDKKELKTVTADEAVMDLDRPLGLTPNKPGAPPLRIVHAQITGNVQIRDDRGTTDRGDDMVIGPLPYVEYDEPTLQIRSESDVVIQDRDMYVSGYELLIQLRPKEETDPTAKTGGFDGAKTAYLMKNAHVILYDSGRSGILPGNARAERATGTAERTPVDLRCAGMMQIDLPRPRLPVRVGPPAPPDPTFATFKLNVVVLQAKPNQPPDQLNCDELKLTLLPGKKAPTAANSAGPGGTAASASAAAEAAPDPTTGGALGGLTLRRADATGHAVWLQSVSNGLKTRSNQLIYKKQAPEKPDETYLRGDPTTKLLVEKVDLIKEGPDKGKPGPVTNIRAIDATIFDDGQSRDPETIIARGPGILETRPARDKPVERRAVWQDQLVQQNEIGADKQLRKRITLTGDPRFYDLAQATTLDAKSQIIIWLKPKAEPAAPVNTTTAAAAGSSPSPVQVQSPAQAQAQAQAQPGGGKFDIELLRAVDDVHLVAPGRTLSARDVLVSVFETLPAAPSGTAVAPAGGTPAVASAAGGPTAPVGAPVGAQAAAPAAPPATQAEAKPATKPADPDVRVQANHVWARITLRPKAEQGGAASTGTGTATADRSGPGNNTQSEVREARLRGAVYFHEDPAPGKQRGTNVTGEAIDVTNLGENRMYFKVYNIDPDKAAPTDLRSRLSKEQLLARIETVGRSFPLARVETDDFTVEGPRIGLNQLTDEAWVDGRGVLTQLAPRGLLSDKGLDNHANASPSPARPAQRLTSAPSPAAASSPAPAGTQTHMTPLRITWTHSMQFKGQSTNPKGLPAGRAHFVANVRAEMEDSLMLAQEMTTYLDRTVKLNRPRQGGAARPAGAGPGGTGNSPETGNVAPEPKPQIALIDCKYKVTVDNRKVDPETGVLMQRQVIFGEQVVYDKLTGNFLALPGPGKMGRVHLYNRDGQETVANPGPGRGPAPASPLGPSTTADRRTIRPTANPTSRPAGNTVRATEVVGRNASPDAAAGLNAGAASTRDKPEANGTPPRKPTLMPLKVTQIVYADEMHGRFGTGKEQDTTDPRWADFFGDVEVLHALVPDDSTVYDFDDPPRDATFLTAQTIRVVSEPPPPGSTAPARNLLKAWENAEAETIDTTIQADKITYDSSKELFYAYGELDQVYFVQTKFVGQPATTASGQTLWYNRRTGESEVNNPQVVQFVDDKFGMRPVWATPRPEVTKPKKPLAPFRGPGRAHFERKGFNGH
jgi:hypothetical protein